MINTYDIVLFSMVKSDQNTDILFFVPVAFKIYRNLALEIRVTAKESADLGG